MTINTVKDAGTVTEEMFDGVNCARAVTTNDSLLEWEWNYAQAAQCGWSWGEEQDKITFAAGFRPSNAVESYIVQNQTILTSLNLDRDINLACLFDNYGKTRCHLTDKTYSPATTWETESLRSK